MASPCVGGRNCSARLPGRVSSLRARDWFTLTRLTAGASIAVSPDLRHADTYAISSRFAGAFVRIELGPMFLADRILACQLQQKATVQTSCYTRHQRTRCSGAVLRANGLGAVLWKRRRWPSLGLDRDRQRCSRNGRSNACHHQYAACQRGRSTVGRDRCRVAYQSVCSPLALAR